VLVELSPDPLFLLAGGSLGTGGRWPFPADVRARGEPLWLRALDLGGGAAREIGRWRLEPLPAQHGFNRVLADFEAELAQPGPALARMELHDLVQELRGRGLEVRLDAQRDWEHARVLCELEELRAERGVERVLDVGGGNGPLAYLLARRGFQVVMLDVDRSAVERTARQAAELGLANLQAVPGGRRWPLADGSFDAAACVSVLEGILRKDRPAFWGEVRRVLRPGAPLLFTCDFGPDARFVGDAPADLGELERDAIADSGLVPAGAAPRAPRFGPAGPPIRARVPTPDGRLVREIAYTFATLRLEKPVTGTGTTPGASPGAGRPAGEPGPG
jgi:SAM-dependent methyltransferase